MLRTAFHAPVCRAFVLALFLASGGDLLASSLANAETDPEAEQGAKKKLAEKLLKLSQSANMKEGTFKDSLTGGQPVNRRDKNPMPSDTTYHSQVWSYCQKWLGPQICEKWYDPYIALHGYEPEQSNLEGTGAAEYEASGGPRSAGQSAPANASGQYAIWDIQKTEGASLLDAQGKLDRNNITKWSIQAKSRRKFEKVGEDTAVRTMRVTVDEDADGDTMPVMEGLRLSAQRFTKMARNRNLAILGDLRAMDEGTEVAINEDFATCAEYASAVRAEPDTTFIQQGRRRNPQPYLSPQAWGKDIARRINECRALQATPYDVVNPTVGPNGQVAGGDQNSEMYEKWRARVAIATIDSVGVDPNELGSPNGLKIDRSEFANTFKDYAPGGRTYQTVTKTNLQQVEGYNGNVDDAADGWAAVAARSDLVDISEKVRNFKKQPKTFDAVSNNGLTREMTEEVGEYYVARPKGAPLEQTPEELTSSAGN